MLVVTIVRFPVNNVCSCKSYQPTQNILDIIIARVSGLGFMRLQYLPILWGTHYCILSCGFIYYKIGRASCRERV